MIQEEGGRVVRWGVDLSLERADPQYVKRYFESRKQISRQRLCNKEQYPKLLPDAAGAMIAGIMDAGEQERLFKLRHQLMEEQIQKFLAEHNLSRREDMSEREFQMIEGIVSDRIFGECQVWYSRFWSVTQQVELVFERREANE